MLSVTNKLLMLNVIMLNVIMLNVIMLNVIMLNVIMLNVIYGGSTALEISLAVIFFLL
jgi:hypothetical protein